MYDGSDQFQWDLATGVGMDALISFVFVSKWALENMLDILCGIF